MISMKVRYCTIVSSNNFLTTHNGFLSVIINYLYIHSQYMPSSLVDGGLRLRRECERIEKEELWVVSCLCEYYHDTIPYVSVVSWLSSNNFLTTRKGNFYELSTIHARNFTTLSTIHAFSFWLKLKNRESERIEKNILQSIACHFKKMVSQVK